MRPKLVSKPFRGYRTRISTIHNRNPCTPTLTSRIYTFPTETPTVPYIALVAIAHLSSLKHLASMPIYPSPSPGPGSGGALPHRAEDPARLSFSQHTLLSAGEQSFPCHG